MTLLTLIRLRCFINPSRSRSVSGCSLAQKPQDTEPTIQASQSVLLLRWTWRPVTPKIKVEQSIESQSVLLLR